MHLCPLTAACLVVGAASGFSQSPQTSPKDAASWLKVAEAAAREHDSKRAVDAAQKAEGLVGSDPAILHELARFYVQLAPDLAKAADLEFRYAELRPAADQGAFERAAHLYFDARKPERAIVAAGRAVAVRDKAELHTLMGKSYALAGKWEPALQELTKARDMSPFDEGPIFDLSQAYLYREDFKAAATVLEAGRKSFDKSPQIELALGVAYYGLRRFPEAVDQFLNTIRLSPDIPQPYVFLGRILEQGSGRMDEIGSRFAEYQARHPESYLGYLLRGKALTAQLPPAGFPAEASQAERLFRKSMQLKEDDPESHFELGCLLERKREFAEAARHLERSAALRPNDAATHYRLARVYDRLGRAADADAQRAIHAKLNVNPRRSGMQPAAPDKLQ